MNKRRISFLLALLMVVTLLPFGAAAARINGPDAFTLLQRFALENGTYSNGYYVYQCDEEKLEDMPGTFYLKYDTSTNSITLSSRYTKSGFNFDTDLVIRGSLRMPFDARQQISGLMTSLMATRLDSSFTPDAELVLTEESSEFQLDDAEEVFRYCLAVLLMDVQDFCFDGTRFSVGDLGFTAFADGAGYDYDVPMAEPVITAQPKNVTAKVGDTVIFSVRATGEELTYQWQFMAPGTTTWYDSGMEGATTEMITVKATAARNGQQYRCVVKNSAGQVVSNAAKLTALSKPAITAQPESVLVAYGDTAKFTVKATGGSLTYQWQYLSPGSSTWKNSGMAGAKTATLSVISEKARNGQKYRCIVSNAMGSVTSEPATLSTAATVQPAIKTQPKAVSVKAGDTATFTVKATGGNLSYQWQFKAPGTSTWYNSGMTGSRTATLSVPATTARNGQQYRCIVTNAAGSVTSNAAKLTVSK